MMVLPNGNPSIETIIEIDATRAAKAARIRAGDRGVQLVSVISTQLVIGECAECEAPILQGSCFATKPLTGERYCEACAR